MGPKILNISLNIDFLRKCYMTRVPQNNTFDKFCSFKNFDRSNIYGARELFVFYCVGVEPWSNIHNAFVFVIQFLNPRDVDKTVCNRLTSIQ